MMGEPPWMGTVVGNNILVESDHDVGPLHRRLVSGVNGQYNS